MASAFESSSRNSDSETKLYSDIVCLDGVESEVNRLLALKSDSETV